MVYQYVQILTFLMASLHLHALGKKTSYRLDSSSDSSLVIPDSLFLGNPNHFMLTDRLKVLYDTNGNYETSDILQKSDEFVHLDHPLIDRVSSKVKAFWLVLGIDNRNASSRWYLGLHQRDIEFKLYDESGLISEGVTGTNQRIISGLNWLTPMPFIPLDLEAGHRYQIVLRVTPKIITTVGHRHFDDLDRSLVNLPYLYEYRYRTNSQVFIAIGILVTVFVYHLVLFLYNGKVTFLHLSLFSFFLCLAKLLYNGIIFTGLGLDSYGFFNDISVLLLYASGAIAFRFTSSYLQIPSSSIIGRSVKLFESLWIFCFLSTLLLLVISENYFLSNQSIIAKILTIQTIFQQPFLLIIGLISLVKGNKNAIYYVLALSIWFSIHFINILDAHNLMHVSSSFPRDIIGATGMILFSFGLASQFKKLQVEKIVAENKRKIANQLRQIDQQEAIRLKELNRFKSQLYTNITHEFRTPLTVISGMADQLVDQSGEKELIQRNTENLLDLVNQMLDLSKFDAGKLRPKLVQTDIVPQLKYLSETYDHLARSQGKIFHLELLEDVLWLDIDPSFFERILNNLVHNALKFSPQGGTIKVRLQKINDRVIITISDQGRGISSANQEKIFDRFYQIDTSPTRRSGGTGIGLALAKDLVTLLHGKISVTSGLGTGSTFTITLPITNIMPVETLTLKHPTKTTTSTPDTSVGSTTEDLTTIVIVEDHADVRQYLRTLLSSTYQLIEADNGRTGLSLASEHIPDLIISDVMMPEMDGFELCQSIKTDQRTSHIPVILITAKSTQASKLEGLKEGADAYLVKPFDKRELFVRINNLLAHQQKLQQYYQQFHMLPEEKVKDNNFLQMIKKHLEQNIGNENYQIEDLGDAVHLGRVQLFRKLKALTGKNYTELIREMRVHRAKELLKKTDLTINEIAFQVGFKEGSYFGKVFKKEVGMSAGEYRK